jgi:hypothetical protein
MEDFKGVHPGVMVYVLALQTPNPAQISFFNTSIASFSFFFFMHSAQ